MGKNKEEFKVIENIETNPFYDPRRMNTGGGYAQPKITFLYNGQKGYFHNTSCGEFGDRYELEMDDGRCAKWGSLTHPHEYSTFEKVDIPFLNVIKKNIGVTVPTREEAIFMSEEIKQNCERLINQLRTQKQYNVDMCEKKRITLPDGKSVKKGRGI